MFSKGVFVRLVSGLCGKEITLYSIYTHFDALTTDSIENIVGKGEIACSEQFLLFPLCFPLNQITVSPFVHIVDIISLFAAEFKEPKIGISGRGLMIKCQLPSINGRKISD